MATRRVKRRARKSRTRSQRGGSWFAKAIGAELTNDSALALLQYNKVYPSVDKLIRSLHEDLFNRYPRIFRRNFLGNKGVADESQLKDYQKTQLAKELELGINMYTFNPMSSTREKFETLISLRHTLRDLTLITAGMSTINDVASISDRMKGIRQEIQYITSQPSQPTGWSKLVTNSGETYYEHTDGRVQWNSPSSM